MNILITGDGPAAMLAGAGLKKHKPQWSVAVLLNEPAPQPGQILTNPVVADFSVADSQAQAAIAKVMHKSSGVTVSRLDVAEAAVIPGLTYASAGYGALRAALMPLAEAAGCVFIEPNAGLDVGSFDLVLIADQSALDALGVDAALFATDRLASGRSSIALETEGGPQTIAFAFGADENSSYAVYIPTRDGRGTLVIEVDDQNVPADDPVATRALVETFSPALSGAVISNGAADWRSSAVHIAQQRISGKYVLFGSAVASVHHSIGLQARHDLEDAEALVGVLLQSDGQRGQGLQDWQEAGKRRSASYQRAADASAQWLAKSAAWRELPLEQFAFACATRSFRMGYKRVQAAAPEFVRDLDALVAGPAAAEQNQPPPPMFTPYAMRDLALPNRMVFSPMCMYSAVDGTVNDFHNVHLGARAVGGFGLVIAEMTNVTAQGRMTPGCAGIYAPEHVPAWKRATDFVHQHTQSKIGIQLAHAGRKGSIGRSWEKYDPVKGEEMWEVIAPSAIPFTQDRPVPREMTRADIRDTVEAFAKAARMSVEAGFDMIELHMAHGYLISEFISPLANHRGDEYGGSLQNRMRFPLEVFEAVRAQAPDGMPIAARISAHDFDPEGVTPRESIEISRILHEAGVDIIAVSTAGVTSGRRPAASQRLYQLALCEAIRHEAKTPAMAIGGLVSHTDCNMIIASGRADLCVMARGAMNEPYFPHHAANEQGYRFDWPLPYARADETVIRAS